MNLWIKAAVTVITADTEANIVIKEAAYVIKAVSEVIKAASKVQNWPFEVIKKAAERLKKEELQNKTQVWWTITLYAQCDNFQGSASTHPQ